MSVSDFIQLREAVKLFPQRPHYSTLKRWSFKGINGVRLRTAKFGHSRLTKPEWVDDFILKAIKACPDKYAEAETSDAPATAAHKAADAELDAMGCV
jgi:hypothetical protein